MFKTILSTIMVIMVSGSVNVSAGEGNKHSNMMHAREKENGKVVLARSKREKPPADHKKIKTFVLDVEGFELEPVTGVKTPAWGFKLAGGKPSAPGPEIRVKEGDYVRLILKNTHMLPHTIHAHGADTPFDMDGAETTQPEGIPDGETYIYEFYAKVPGTHWYHCHYQTVMHQYMGMYGAFIVEPKKPEKFKYDKEVTLVLDEWRIGDDKDNVAVQNLWPYGYNYFTINGKSFPETEDIEMKIGQRLKVRFINAGYMAHFIHLHGHKMLVTHSDGVELKSPYWKDTLPIGPGERYDVVIKVDNESGEWMIHDHSVPAATNNGTYPGGMTMILKY